MKKRIIAICIVCLTVILGICVYCNFFKEKDYSFKINNIDIGKKNIYVVYEIGEDIDGEKARINKLTLSDGDKKVFLDDFSTIKTESRNVYIEKYDLKANFPNRKAKEITDILNEYIGKRINVNAEFQYEEKKEQKVNYNISYKVNNFIDEIEKKVNTPFAVDDDDIVNLKSLTIDKYFITLNIENEDDVESYVLFDLKDKDNNTIQNLGGTETQQIFRNKKGLNSVTISAYTNEHPLDEKSMRINVPIK